MQIVQDEFRIVVTDEFKAPHLNIDRENGNGEAERNPEIELARRAAGFGYDAACWAGFGQFLMVKRCGTFDQ